MNRNVTKIIFTKNFLFQDIENLFKKNEILDKIEIFVKMEIFVKTKNFG